MKTLTILSAAATFVLATAASAQSAQDRLDERYNRALAAGYKALMLCSATANAERNQRSRSPESIEQWELTGIYPVLDPIIRTLPHQIVREGQGTLGGPKGGFVRHVAVQWEEGMHPRVAVHTKDNGCAVMPIGYDPESLSDQTADFRWAAPTYSAPTLTGGAEIRRVADAAFDGTYGEGSRTTAVSVFASGEYPVEQFSEGFDRSTPQRTWSVAKSLAATFVGMAVHRQAANVGDSAGVGESESDPRNAITIDHMLRMASGRYSDTAGNRTDPLYWGGTTVDERAANWPLINRPGTVYRYANNDTLMAIEAIQPWLERRTASSLLEELGMFDAVVENDWQGNYVLSSQVWASTSDFMQLGQLYLNDGVRNNRRLLPANWRDYVSDPSGPQPEGTSWGYGAGWWTFRRPEGNAFEGIPDDAFAARGNRGQYVVVVPSRNVVIVRRGEDMVGTRFDIAAFTRDVLAALEE